MQVRSHTSNGEVCGVAVGAFDHPIFCVAKTKKGNKGEKERVSKQKLLNSYHQGENVTVLVMFTVLYYSV